MNTVIHMNGKDNLVTCLREVKKGEVIEVDGQNYVARADIPKFHKMSTAHIAKGETCLKYGESIGIASEDIAPGDYVHSHNLRSADTAKQEG